MARSAQDRDMDVMAAPSNPHDWASALAEISYYYKQMHFF